MLSDRTIALFLPFLVATSQASAVDTAREGVVAPTSAPQVQVLSSGFNCHDKGDWGCYKKYYDEYKYCHPYDGHCYRDCQDWNEYKDHCFHKDYKCYDKCYYNHDDCHKWDECHDNDWDCYKKKHEHYYPVPDCHHDDEHCHKEHEDHHDYCKPWDFKCHEKYHKDDDYECSPWKDKHCYPYYYPEPYCPKERPRQPRENVHVWFYSPCDGPCGTNGYYLEIWPDGDEVWTEQKDVVVDHIKYYAARDDEDIRCLPMMSYFPWTPIPLERYVEKFDTKDGKKVRILHLKEPQPVEVLRCDFP